MPSYCRPLLGTFVEVTSDREDAIEAAFGAIERVHRLMSAHEPDSDVSRINRLAHLSPVEVDPWTALVIERALFWSKESEGAFDIVRAGKEALESGLIPRHADQPQPLAAHWSWLEVQGNKVRLLKSACIDLGGIAKGFAVDKAIDALRKAGAAFGLVNAGGDIAGFGPREWPATVVEPRNRQPAVEIGLVNAALATSSILSDEIDHLPGRNLDLVSASVEAKKAIDADALTKVLLSGSPATKHCLALADAQALVILADGTVQSVEAFAKAA